MIKKILGIVVVSLFLSSSTVLAADLSGMCAQPYDLSTKGMRFLTAATGMTPLAHSIANSIIKKELVNSTGVQKGFKVKMKSFSAKDLASGRFKSLKITGKDLNFDGVYVSKFNAETICDFNYVIATKKDIKFKENFGMNYSMTVTDEDLQKTVLSKNYLKFLYSLNVKVGGLNLMELKDVNVKFNDDKFLFSLKMDNKMFNYSLPLNMDVSTQLSVKNGKFVLSHVTIENLNKKINLTQFTNMLNTINPLSYTVNVLNNKDSKIAIDSLDIKGDKLILEGTLFVPKNTVESIK